MKLIENILKNIGIGLMGVNALCYLLLIYFPIAIFPMGSYAGGAYLGRNFLVVMSAIEFLVKNNRIKKLLNIEISEAKKLVRNQLVFSLCWVLIAYLGDIHIGYMFLLLTPIYFYIFRLLSSKEGSVQHT